MKSLASDSSRISLQACTHSSQMKVLLGPFTNLRTWSWDLPQNEQRIGPLPEAVSAPRPPPERSVVLESAMRYSPSFLEVTREVTMRSTRPYSSASWARM